MDYIALCSHAFQTDVFLNLDYCCLAVGRKKLKDDVFHETKN